MANVWAAKRKLQRISQKWKVSHKDPAKVKTQWEGPRSLSRWVSIEWKLPLASRRQPKNKWWDEIHHQHGSCVRCSKWTFLQRTLCQTRNLKINQKLPTNYKENSVSIHNGCYAELSYYRAGNWKTCQRIFHIMNTLWTISLPHMLNYTLHWWTSNYSLSPYRVTLGFKKM